MLEEGGSSHYDDLAIFDKINLTSDQFQAISVLILKL
jgi:hypothetical protein